MNSVGQNAIHCAGSLRESRSQAKSYGGIGRLGYFFGVTGVNILGALVCAAAGEESIVGILTVFVALGLSFFLIASRLRNSGTSPWWCLLALVPIANLILGIRCLMMPEGYQDTKTLDTAAKVILGIVVGVAVLLVVGLVSLG